MPAAGVWWGSTRGSPSAGLMRELGPGMDARAPATEQQLELRGRAGSGEGEVDAGRGRAGEDKGDTEELTAASIRAEEVR